MELKTTAGLVKELLAFTVPLILSGMLQQLFNWADAFIVGNFVGETALAGVGITTSVYNMFVTIIVGFTSGISVLSAQQYGSGEKHRLKQILAVFSAVSAAVFAVVAAAGIIFTGRILVVLGTPAELMSDAKAYLTIIFTGIPFLAVYNIYSAVLRGTGNSRTSFIAVIISSVINLVLDIIFVAALNYGTAGAAAATVISQAAMTVYIVAYSIRKYEYLRFKAAEIKNLKILRMGGIYGTPPAVQSGISSIGNIALQKFMNGFGEQTVAAITTAYRVDSLILLPVINFSTGISTMVAYNKGAGDKELVRRVFNIGIVITIVISLSLTAVVLFFGKDLLGMFGLSEETVYTGRRFFNIISAFYLIYGLGMALKGYLEGISDMLFSAVAGILSLAVRIICSYVFDDIFSNMVIAYAEAFSWVFLLAVFAARYMVKRN